MSKKQFSQGVLVAIFGLAIATVWLRLAIIRRTYEVNQLDLSARNVSREIVGLKVQLAKAKTPSHLERLARKWGFSQPSTEQLVRLEEQP